MNSLISKLIIALSIVGLSLSTYASTGGGSYGSSSRGGDYGNSRQNRRAVDQTYELGKSVYLGKRGTKLNYCIDNGTDKVKLKSKTAKKFKRKAANEFLVALYDCNQPDIQVANIIDKGDVYALVYYFNKRYRLNLTGL